MIDNLMKVFEGLTMGLMLTRCIQRFFLKRCTLMVYVIYLFILYFVQNSSREALIRSFQLAFSLLNISLAEGGRLADYILMYSEEVSCLFLNLSYGNILKIHFHGIFRVTCTITSQISLYTSDVNDNHFRESVWCCPSCSTC